MALLTCRRDGDIALVMLENPPVNALSTAVRQQLWSMTERLDADPETRAVVLIGAGRNFIAGADIREFGQPPQPPLLPDLVDRIEDAAKPWIAAIHGSALGGGLEIALGCRFRVAGADARIGLPEVSLGLIPGASGTVRTPRLAGVAAAVQLITSGLPWSAEKAYREGLIDAVIETNLLQGALEFARKALLRPLPPPTARRAIHPQSDLFWRDARNAAAKTGQQAPLRALDCIRQASETPFSQAMRVERKIFMELRDSDESRALRHVFFAERAAARPEHLAGVIPRELSRIGIVGGGTMGAGIAVACRRAGLEVALIERDDAALERGRENIDRILAGAVNRGKLTEDGRRDTLAGIAGTTEYAGLSGCDLVVEAVFERIEVKREVFARLSESCAPEVILATNTSYLDPRRIAEGVVNPQRFLGLHFFSPAHLMKLLEIVPVPDTSPEVLATSFALARRLGKVPVQAGICEGFIGNRIFRRYRSEAESLVREGVALQDIDKAMREFGFRMGPFEVQDLSGLDIAFLQREGMRAQGRDIPDTFGDLLVRAGRKGRKSGGGWYDYPKDGTGPMVSARVTELLAAHVEKPRQMSAREIADQLVRGMAHEGRAILDDGIARDAAQIDLVQIHGYGFPRWKGGPMWWAGHRG